MHTDFYETYTGLIQTLIASIRAIFDPYKPYTELIGIVCQPMRSRWRGQTDLILASTDPTHPYPSVIRLAC